MDPDTVTNIIVLNYELEDVGVIGEPEAALDDSADEETIDSGEDLAETVSVRMAAQLMVEWSCCSARWALLVLAGGSLLRRRSV